jgi:hypothetical protein
LGGALFDVAKHLKVAGSRKGTDTVATILLLIPLHVRTMFRNGFIRNGEDLHRSGYVFNWSAS